MEIRIFGQLTDITGSAQLTLPLVADTDHVLRILADQYPGLATMTFRVAVNGKLVDGCIPLFPGDVIALLPPFSGG
jgi:molybdopterin converting factor small subunit